MRRRLDHELVRRGLAANRSEARAAIVAGRVSVEGSAAGKAGTLVAPSEAVSVSGAARRFVSRGGEKLDPTLEVLGVSVEGRRCLDAGASTGGFTDVLLSRGAAHVVALDVGYGQLAWSLRGDERVTVMERTNVRELRPDDLPYAAELLVADLSFISLRTVAEALVGACAPDADMVVLVKPQFEVGRNAVGRGGVVSQPEAWRDAVDAVARALADEGSGAQAVVPSPVRGPAGNVEFFLHARRGAEALPLDLDRALSEVPA